MSPVVADSSPVASTPPATLATALKKLDQLRKELKATLIERDGEIDAILLALLAGEHVLLLGPWGSAKSALANALSEALDTTSFSILLTKHTTPEEPFGPYDLPALKQGKYTRITQGRFPAAEIAFLDEIFKSSSAILNGFLTALNERCFDNGGVRQSIPLKLCIAASNELPQDEGLGALFDRFLIRRWTRYIADRDNKRRLLLMRGEPRVQTRITAEELNVLRAAREAVDYQPVVESLLNLGDDLAAEGIEVSDRRWRKACKVVQASAVLNGRSKAEVEDLMPLADVLWDDPEDYSKVYGVVAKTVSPDLQKALALLDSATELWTKAGAANADLSKPEVLQKMAALNNELKNVGKQLSTLKQGGAVKECTDKVRAMHQSLAQRIQKQISGSW